MVRSMMLRINREESMPSLHPTLAAGDHEPALVNADVGPMRAK